MKTTFLTTNDNVKIAINHYHNGNDTVVIVLPGWCMTKDSKAFKSISEMFSEKFDVITFDFRGHGKSSGFFTFTAVEIIDLDKVVRYARKYYKNIYLAGFSLGGAMAVIYASKSKFINKVIAVSAPCEFSKIENQMWKKEAWLETFKKFELSRFASIRPFPIPMKKEKPCNLVNKIKVPILFIAGGKDPTVHSWHTKRLYDIANCPKKYKCFENGFHAEDLYLHYKDEFSKLCIDFLEQQK